MKIIGHRGAAGLALENTLPGFELATLLGVDAIELDVRISKDRHLVIVHDSDLKRVSGQAAAIKSHTLARLRKITLSDGRSTVPTLEEVIAQTGNVPLIVELKVRGCLDEVIELLAKHPERDITIASFWHNELTKLRKLDANVRLFGLEGTRPFDIIHLARSAKFNGIGLNYWLLNPLTYWAARRYKLDMYVYTVNSSLIGKIIRTLYPQVSICSDYPERFMNRASPPATHADKKDTP